MKNLESTSLVSEQSSIRFLLLMMVLLGVFPLDVILPSFPAIATHFNTPAENIALSVSVFAVGFAISQLLLGPLSDRLGRKRLLMVGMVVSIAGAVGCANAVEFSGFIFFRCIQAVGCGCFVLSNALVQDVFVDEERERMRILMTTASGVFISLSPLFGTLLESVLGWTGSFYLFAIIAGLVLVHASRVLRDSRVANSEGELWRPSAAIVSNARFMGFSLIAAIAFACHFSFIAISPLIFLQGLGLSQLEFSWVLLGYGVAYVIGGIVASRLQRSMSHQQQLQSGMLLIALAGLVLFWLTAADGGRILSLLLPMIICTTGSTVARPAATSRAMDIFPEQAGAASSLLNTVVFVTGAIVSAAASMPTIDYQYVLALFFVGFGIVGWTTVRWLYNPARR